MNLNDAIKLTGYAVLPDYSTTFKRANINANGYILWRAGGLYCGPVKIDDILSKNWKPFHLAENCKCGCTEQELYCPNCNTPNKKSNYLANVSIEGYLRCKECHFSWRPGTLKRIEILEEKTASQEKVLEEVYTAIIDFMTGFTLCSTPVSAGKTAKSAFKDFNNLLNKYTDIFPKEESE